MRKVLFIGFMAAIFMVAINVSAIWADDQSEAYIVEHNISQGGQDCNTPACVKARVKTSAPAPSKKVRIASVQKNEPCDVCEKLAEIATTTGIINQNVGEATPEEKANGLGTVHKKESYLIKSVGTSKPKPGMPEKSLHGKVGEPAKPDQTIFGELSDIKEMLESKSGPGKWWWLIPLLILIGVIVGATAVVLKRLADYKAMAVKSVKLQNGNGANTNEDGAKKDKEDFKILNPAAAAQPAASATPAPGDDTPKT